MTLEQQIPGAPACQHCARRSPDFIVDFCSACWFPRALLSPPVQHAKKDEEIRAVDERYSAALSTARTRGCLEPCASFERAVRERSHAVVCMPWAVFLDINNDFRKLYTTYTKQVDLGARLAALPEHDIQRRLVETALWGHYGEQVCTAALSLDGSGLSSYGDVFAELDDTCVAYRSAVLETNSYEFVRSHPFSEERNRPAGYLATWENRGKLALVKHVYDIEQSDQDDRFQGILIRSEGERRTDQFMEVHIFGGFNRQAIRTHRKAPHVDRSWVEQHIYDVERLLEDCVDEDSGGLEKK